jgi:REP element-mobilizing transposase RayT
MTNKTQNLEYRIFYKRYLPHIQPPGSTLFVTYRLHGSIPAELLAMLQAEAVANEQALARTADPQQRVQEAYLFQRRMFARWDKALDNPTSGPYWLGDGRIAQIVADSLHQLHNQLYDLDTYCIMSNHGHVLFTPLPNDEKPGTYFSISKIMHTHKRITAILANRVLKRTGQFWQHENYDHYVRNQAERNRIRSYILQNPVKAGLVENWEDWPWAYTSYEL